jgi:hypothetical protein
MCQSVANGSVVFWDAVLQPARSTFIVSILTLSLYSYLYVPHSLSAYWHYHCIPTCTFNIPCQHTETRIVFLPVRSTFLVSILGQHHYVQKINNNRLYLVFVHTTKTGKHCQCFYKVPIKIQFDACNVIIIWRYVGQHVYRSFYL